MHKQEVDSAAMTAGFGLPIAGWLAGTQLAQLPLAPFLQRSKKHCTTAGTNLQCWVPPLPPRLLLQACVTTCTNTATTGSEANGSSNGCVVLGFVTGISWSARSTLAMPRPTVSAAKGVGECQANHGRQAADAAAPRRPQHHDLRVHRCR